MTLLEAIQARHSVRSYQSKPIDQDTLSGLQEEIAACNAYGDLHFQLITQDPKGFSGLLASYGKLEHVENYIALVGEKSSALDEKIGYYGERVVLKAQMLGLNTCWAAMTFKKGAIKSKLKIGKDEKLVCVLALGYGTTQGNEHKSKPIEAVCKEAGSLPDWYQKGIECALLAPTAMNQQKFAFSRVGHQVSVKATGGFYSKVDLGIVKYHFEIGAKGEPFEWVNK